MIKISIAPKKQDGTFEDFIDVTRYVDRSSISDIDIDTNQDEFTVGVAKNSSIDISFLNDNGFFSDENNPNSIFKFSRNGSLVKISFFENNSSAICGEAIAGNAILGANNIDLYEGIIDEVSPRENARNNFVSLTVIGKESIYDRVEIGQNDLNTTQSARFLVFNLLNKPEIRAVLDIESGLPNWSVGVDFIFENLNAFENSDTVQEALEIILKASNSALVVIDNVVFLYDRSPTTEFKFEFISPYVEGALENISELNDISTGINRTFNFWAWESDDRLADSIKSDQSVQKNGLRKNTIDIEGLSQSTQEDILSSYFSEYRFPKQEFVISTHLNQSSAMLKLFDKVRVNFPSQIVQSVLGEPLPRWGQFKWGEAVWPFENSAFTIDRDNPYKIQAITYDLTREVISLSVREV